LSLACFAVLIVHGYEQIGGEHYDANMKAAPVVNDATIKIVFILTTMARWYSEIVHGAFLHGVLPVLEGEAYRYVSRSTTR